MPTQKSWTDRASNGLKQTTNSATIRQNIIDWIEAKAAGWALNSTQRKSFPDQVSNVMVTVTKTGASKVSIDNVEPGF